MLRIDGYRCPVHPYPPALPAARNAGLHIQATDDDKRSDHPLQALERAVLGKGRSPSRPMLFALPPDQARQSRTLT